MPTPLVVGALPKRIPVRAGPLAGFPAPEQQRFSSRFSPLFLSPCYSLSASEGRRLCPCKVNRSLTSSSAMSVV